MGVTGCYTSALHHHSSTEQFKLQGKSTKCILQPDQVTEELYFATCREEGKIGFVSNFCHTELTKNYSPGITKEMLLWQNPEEEAGCLVHVVGSPWKGTARYLTVVWERLQIKNKVISLPTSKVHWKPSCDSLGHQLHSKFRLFLSAYNIFPLQKICFERAGPFKIANVYNV